MVVYEFEISLVKMKMICYYFERLTMHHHVLHQLS
jgi:hypothetical protein